MEIKYVAITFCFTIEVQVSLNVCLPNLLLSTFYIHTIISGNEQTRLEEEEKSLSTATKDLAYKEYHTFIHSSQCSKELGKEVSYSNENINIATNSHHLCLRNIS